MRGKFLKIMIIALGLGMIHASVLAQPSGGDGNVANTPEQAQQAPAGKFIQDLGNEAIGIIADKSLSQEERHKKYHNILQQAFDMETIGHFVLGRTWNTVTPEQQQEYMRLFEGIVVKTYGDRLNFFSGEKFQVKSVRKENDKDSVVSSEVLHPNGTPPTAIEWRVREENSKLAIIDVIVEGVSQSVTQRQEYASILQRNNGDIHALLDLMRQKLQPSGGTEVGQ